MTDLPLTPRTWLIFTTSHAAEDGRLQRHLILIESGGDFTEIISHREPRRAVRFTTAPFKLWSALRVRRPDIVVLPDPELWSLGPLIARLSGIKAVVDVHENYASVAADDQRFHRRGASLAAKAVVLFEKLGRRTAHVTIAAAPELAHGFDVTLRNLPLVGMSTPELSQSSTRMVYVGDVSESRGIWEMLHLVEGSPEMTLDLVGPIPPELRSRVSHWITEHKLTEQVTIHGRLGYANSWDIARGATVGLALLRPTPAYVEATPTKIWEYMAAVIPVLAMALPPAKRLLEQAACGIVADGVAAQRQAIDELRKNRQVFAANGLRHTSTFSEETDAAWVEIVSRLRCGGT